MPIYVQVRDQLYVLASAVFEYNNDTHTHKVYIQTRGRQKVRLVATEKEPIKLALLQSLRSTLTSALQNAQYPINITNHLLRAEKLYHPQDIQGYSCNLTLGADGITITNNPRHVPTSIVLVSEVKSTSKTQQWIHVLEGKTAVKVNQYNLSKGGNIFNVIFNNQLLSLSNNNSLPVLKIEVSPRDIEHLTLKYNSLDGVRRAFDKQVKQATQDLFSNPPPNRVITASLLLNQYQQVLPRFLHHSVVHLSQT